jgi:hypothetical protein
MPTNITLFHKRLYVLLGSLAIFCLLLMVMLWVQGPRIRSARLDASAATSASGQRLVLQSSQPLTGITKKRVTISPKASFNLLASGNNVVIEFTQRLRYQTRYTVGIDTGRHMLQHRFMTGAPVLFYAVQKGGEGDEIRKRDLQTGKDTGVFSGARIADYTVLGETLIVNIWPQGAYTSRLVRVDLETGHESAIDLPEQGMVSQLYASPDKRRIGFTLDTVSESFGSALLTYDVAETLPRIVYGFDDKPLQVVDWRFAPDSRTIAARLLDNTFVLTAIGSSNQPAPLGQFTDLGGFTADGSALILEHKEGAVSVNLKTGRATPVDQGKIHKDTYLVDILPLASRPGYLLHQYSFDNNAYVENITMNFRGRQSAFFRAEPNQSITGVEQTANGELAAVATSKRNADGDPLQEITVLWVDNSKQLVRIKGATPHWQ